MRLAREGRTGVAKYLREVGGGGAVVDVLEEKGMAPLHSAVEGGWVVETARKLLRAGALVGVRNGDGRTPAELAGLKGFRD